MYNLVYYLRYNKSFAAYNCDFLLALTRGLEKA